MIVNLNRYRKERRRAETEAQAVENRVRYGRSKEQRDKELLDAERAKRALDDKRLE